MSSTGSADTPWRRVSSRLGAPALAVLAALLGGCGGDAPPADLILYNGLVHTLVGPPASVVAAADGRIVCVGDDECLAQAGDAARRIDLAGRTVTPGLADSHAHLAGIGLREMTLNLEGTASLAELQARVAERAGRTPPGEWIVGRGWIEARWQPPVFPTREDLDRAAPGRAVYLVRADGHGAVASSKALEIADISGATVAPGGGEILRDASGVPTGMLLDRAKSLVEAHLPPETPERRRQALILGARAMAARGWTQVSIAGASWEEAAMIRELIDAGEIPIRIYLAIGGPGPDADRLLAEGPRVDPDGMLVIRSIKLFLDGALGSKGAALLAPYADYGSDGLMMHEPATLAPLLERALRAGVQIQTHAIGDRANRIALDLYERSMSAVPVGERRVAEPRWRVEHAQILHPDDIPRFAALGVIPSMQPSHAITDLHFALSRLGPERLAGAYAWRSLVDAGAVIAGGSDAAVELGDPLVEIYAASVRKGLDGFSAEHWGDNLKLTRDEALRCFTQWAARATFQEQERGTLEPGKWADLTVISEDILTMDDFALPQARVEMTIVGGRIVHER